MNHSQMLKFLFISWFCSVFYYLLLAYFLVRCKAAFNGLNVKLTLYLYHLRK